MSVYFCLKQQQPFKESNHIIRDAESQCVSVCVRACVCVCVCVCVRVFALFAFFNVYVCVDVHASQCVYCIPVCVC